MNCNEVKTLLSRYIENDVDKFTNKSIRQHLKECNSCKKELELLSSAISIINAATKVKPLR